MALQKPFNINLSGITIDAKESNNITWSVTGDTQYKFKIDIYNNDTNTSVFSSGIITSFSPSYTLTSNVLSNGNEYKLTVTVYNGTNVNQVSDAIIFVCSSRPKVVVPPLSNIGSASYLFKATYSQSENIPVRSWIAYLYNSNKSIIQNSGITTSSPLEYEFSGLEPDNNYYVEFQVTGANGLTNTSGLIPFSAHYLIPIVNVELTGKNIENAGVELSWFIGQILGETDGSQYIDADKIDTRDGSKVWFDNGFNLSNSFSFKLYIESLIGNKPLVKLIGDNGEYILKYDSIQQRFVLMKNIAGITSVYVSEVVNGDKYVVLLEQIGNEINLQATTY